MPKPDTAGRTFPVQRPSLPTLAPDQRLQETKLVSPPISKDRAPKSTRDYWAFAFAAMLIAAMLLLGWRIGKILWGVSSPVKNQSLNRMQTDSVVPKPVPPKTVPDNESRIAPNIALSTVQTNTTANVPHASPIASREREHSKLAAEPIVIRALVGRDGKVQAAQVIRGNRRLSVAALAMVRQLSFNPYAPHGTPLEFETEVTVSESSARGSGDGIRFSVPSESENPQSVTTPTIAEKPSK